MFTNKNNDHQLVSPLAKVCALSVWAASLLLACTYAAQNRVSPETKGIALRTVPSQLADRSPRITPEAGSATITVNSLADVQANNSQCTLREALLNANNNNQSGSIDCPAGSGADTIAFSVTGTINLTGALTDITDSLTINGPGTAQLTVRRATGGNYRIFSIPGTGLNISISGLTISNGRASNFGGGIYSLSNLTLTECAITDNESVTSGGGGILLGLANGIFKRCTISDNASYQQGGGINFQGDGGRQLSLENCTISGNKTQTSGYGVGIYHLATMGTSNLSVYHCTISENLALGGGSQGGGIRTEAQGGTAVTDLYNSIIAGNSAPNLVKAVILGAADVNSHGYNLANDNGSGFLISLGDKTSVTPRLAPLGYYGGPTQTHALLGDSPAIDAVATNFVVVPAVDQRGYVRTSPMVDGDGDGVALPDIGAYELHSKFVNAISGNDGNDGRTPGTAFKTIAKGIVAASSGDDLLVAAGTYNENNLVVNKSINFQGAGAGAVIVDGGQLQRVFEIGGGQIVGMYNLTISHGKATDGGGIQSNSAILSLVNCMVTGNTATGFSGGVDINGGLGAITNSTTSGTQADSGGGLGIFFARAAIVGSTISGNSSNPSEVSGIMIQDSTTALTNCTVSGNTSTGIAHLSGGSSSTLTITGCTIAGNASPVRAGGVFTQGSSSGPVTTMMKNNLVASNIGGNFQVAGIGAAVVTLGYNLDSDGTSGFISGANGDIVGTTGSPLDARIGPLTNNGGPTHTHATLSGSPARDAIPVLFCSLATDQRGVLRPRRVNCDVGAFEFDSWNSFLPIVQK
jgi:CSLREA domain-containing protein